MSSYSVNQPSVSEHRMKTEMSVIYVQNCQLSMFNMNLQVLLTLLMILFS